MQIKRVMLANLKRGERITYTTFEQGKPMRVEKEVIRIELDDHFGRPWTNCGPLPWQPLTSKYEVRLQPRANVEKCNRAI